MVDFCGFLPVENFMGGIQSVQKRDPHTIRLQWWVHHVQQSFWTSVAPFCQERWREKKIPSVKHKVAPLLKQTSGLNSVHSLLCMHICPPMQCREIVR